MPSRSQPNNNIRLPQSLLDQLDGAPDPDTISRPRRSRAHPQKNNVSRKESRKQDREEKKRRKAQYFSSTIAHPERAATPPHPESPPPKRRRVAEPSRSLLPGLKNETSSELASKKPKDVTLHKAASDRRRDHPDAYTLPRSRQEIEEDRHIAFLEAKLNSGKTSRKRTGFIKDIDKDGLGDLLGDLDAITTVRSVKHPDQFSNDSIPLPETGLVTSDQNQDEVCSDESGHAELEEWHGIHDTNLEMAALVVESHTNPSSDHRQLPVKPPVAGNPRYLPPHLREEPQKLNKSDSDVKLTRQLKGLLNKLSEPNIATVLGNIEALYREHRRHDVTTSITSFVIEVVSAHSALLDSHVILHAALVSSLHRIIGAEFAASFVQNVVSSYEHHYSALASSSAISGDALSEPSGKECANLIVLLSELYNFQVISCILVYDIIRNLLSAELTEYVVELLLKLLRNSGQQLRQDDPSALKYIVQIVQSKTSDTETPLSSRTRFMLETLTNLKNNKTKRAATQPAGGDVTERLKKFLTGLSKTRHLVAHDPLRVSLDDLHSADTRGKWWLVGAGWSGDPLVERQENSKRASNTRDDDAVESTLLKLAKKQGMNTDVRRSIFVVLMSSEDYVDACERLAQLNLTEVQQREVIRVLVSCCGNERSYNPYYAFVGQHLCRTSHSYKITLQFCLWDFLRGIGESSAGGAEVLKSLKGSEEDATEDVSLTKMNNVANAYAWWVAKGCVTLSVFKPVDFTVLKPRTRDFLSYFFRQLFVNSQTSVPTLQSDAPPTRDKASLEETFVKAARIQVLAMGLVYFLTEMKKGSEEEFIRWAIGVAIDALRTGLDIVPAL